GSEVNARVSRELAVGWPAIGYRLSALRARALLGDYARGGQRIDRAASQDQYRDREGASRRRVSATPRGPARGWPRAPGTTRRLRPRRRAHRPGRQPGPAPRP